MHQLPVGAVKSYLGHSIGCAGGDQIAASLGIFHSGFFPGVTTIDHLAEDVHASHLNIPFSHLEVGREGFDAGVINAKGFGGNNASATLLAPHVVKRMLEKHYGRDYQSYLAKNEAVQAKASQYDEQALAGKSEMIYRFDYQVCDEDDVHFENNTMSITGFDQGVNLNVESAYAGLLDD
jgi:acetoacetyl-[acyl-carrier protein] synthase